MANTEITVETIPTTSGSVHVETTASQTESHAETTTASHSEVPTTNQILTGVGVQVLNLIIFAVIFWKLMGKKIVKGFEERKKLIAKVENAEEHYKTRMQEAEEESKKLTQEGLKRKEEIIAEAGSLAGSRRDEILSEAHNRAEQIVDEAERRTETIQTELENNFATSVKKTSQTVLNKLLKKDANLKGEYLDEVVKEVIK